METQALVLVHLRPALTAEVPGAAWVPAPCAICFAAQPLEARR